MHYTELNKKTNSPMNVLLKTAPLPVILPFLEKKHSFELIIACFIGPFQQNTVFPIKVLTTVLNTKANNRKTVLSRNFNTVARNMLFFFKIFFLFMSGYTSKRKFKNIKVD